MVSGWFPVSSHRVTACRERGVPEVATDPEVPPNCATHNDFDLQISPSPFCRLSHEVGHGGQRIAHEMCGSSGRLKDPQLKSGQSLDPSLPIPDAGHRGYNVRPHVYPYVNRTRSL